MSPRSLLNALILAGLPLVAGAGQTHTFDLEGGYFYGPGPVVPDTALPPGQVRGIRFDPDRLEGEAAFIEGQRRLSDDRTTTNGNIDGGNLAIGGEGEGKSFWLYAVSGGPNQGREVYHFDQQYNMVWTVDLALDPGFPEGIVRVDNYQLTTGQRVVPRSLQTERGMPGGYDKAGSLASGTVLVGRVGDFDFDGFLDGILVGTANVPLRAELLPGAPVGNRRGFKSDIPVDSLLALELTLHGVADLQSLVEENLTGGHIDQLTHWLQDAFDRVLVARGHYEAAYLTVAPEKRHELKEIGWRLESIRQMLYIPLAFLTTYDYPTGNASGSVVDATGRAFAKAHDLAGLLERRRTGGLP